MQDLVRKIAIVQRATKKTPLHIEIVRSTNRLINTMAEGPQLSLQRVLSQHYTNVGITPIDTMADLAALAAKKPDLVISGLKPLPLDLPMGYGSPKVRLSDYLVNHGINFTGSDTTALGLAFDKSAAKQAVIDAGLQSAAYFIAPIGQAIPAHGLQFPLFVKPTNRSGSKGIDEMSVVNTEDELRTKVRAIHDGCNSDAIIEEYLPGREFSVAVLRQPRSRSMQAKPIEVVSPMDANGNSFLSEAVKKADSEKVIAVTDPALRAALNTLAIGAFQALGARDYGRIDMRLDAAGVPRFIEANLMPGMSDHGYLRRCFALNGNMSYEYMVLSIVRLALERKTARTPIL